MSRWLLHYTPPAVLIRLLTTNFLLAYTTSLILYLSGASDDPRLLLPAWISIATTLTVLYHVSQRRVNIKRESGRSVGLLGFAGFVSMGVLLGQLHATRVEEGRTEEVPALRGMRWAWKWVGRWWGDGREWVGGW